MTDHKRTAVIVHLLQCWNTVVQNDTRPYGYEVFVRLEKYLKDSPGLNESFDSDDRFGILPSMVSHVREGRSDYNHFAKLWSESRKRVKKSINGQ